MHIKLLPLSVLALTIATSPAGPAGRTPAKFERDRQAILSMAGEFKVQFNFTESVALQPGYKLRSPYQEEAVELVTVVEDSGERIVLQHLLLTEGGTKVIKHWKQTWTHEDPVLYEFKGHDRWIKRELTADQIEGTWTQSVAQVDDSPRYESYGKWKHQNGISTWQSHLTARPLPRREHTKRTDYHILMAVNRQTITPLGWTHEEDNTKVVLDADGTPIGMIAREFGVNYYDRADDVDCKAAQQYWEATKDFWGQVSAFWDTTLSDNDRIALRHEADGTPVWKRLFELAKTIQEGGSFSDDELLQILQSYIVRES